MRILAHMEGATPTTESLPKAIRDLKKTWHLDLKPESIAKC